MTVSSWFSPSSPCSIPESPPSSESLSNRVASPKFSLSLGLPKLIIDNRALSCSLVARRGYSTVISSSSNAKESLGGRGSGLASSCSSTSSKGKDSRGRSISGSLSSSSISSFSSSGSDSGFSSCGDERIGCDTGARADNRI